MADVDISSISFGDTTYNLKDPSKYEKPAGGIPYSDLESSVRASLDKADSALQEHQSLAAYRTSAAQDVIDAGKLSASSKGAAGGVAELDANGKVPVAQCPIEEDVAQATTDWLDDHIAQETGYVLDDTLTVSGAAADAKKTGDEISDLKSVVNNSDTGLASKAPAIIKTASGSIVSFSDSVDEMPVKKLIVDIEPMQATGTPTSEAPILIAGWTGCNVYATGKNLFDVNKITEGRYIDENGALKSVASYFATNYISVRPNTTYRVSKLANSNVNRYIAFYTDKSAASFIAPAIRVSTTSITFTTPDGCHYLRFCGAVSLKNNIMLTVGEDEQGEYTPYQGTTISISFPAEAGTVYSGSLTINTDGSGELHKRPYYASFNGETLVGPWVSSMDVYAEGTTPTIGAQVVDLGGTETIYQTTVQQVITTLLGLNVIRSDCGDVSVAYAADTKLYIDHLDIDPTLSETLSKAADKIDDITQSLSMTNNTGIKADTGAYVSITDVKSTKSYIDVSKYDLIRFMNPVRPESSVSSTSFGMAFYSDKSESSYIRGYYPQVGTAPYGAENTIRIPDGAKYMRLTYWTDAYAESISAPAFYCYLISLGIEGHVNELNNNIAKSQNIVDNLKNGSGDGITVISGTYGSSDAQYLIDLPDTDVRCAVNFKILDNVNTGDNQTRTTFALLAGTNIKKVELAYQKPTEIFSHFDEYNNTYFQSPKYRNGFIIAGLDDSYTSAGSRGLHGNNVFSIWLKGSYSDVEPTSTELTERSEWLGTYQDLAIVCENDTISMIRDGIGADGNPFNEGSTSTLFTVSLLDSNNEYKSLRTLYQELESLQESYNFVLRFYDLSAGKTCADLLQFGKVKLVGLYNQQINPASSSHDYYYDSYPVDFVFAKDESLHTLEIVKKGNHAWIAVNGRCNRVYMKTLEKIYLLGGSVQFMNLEINKGSLGDVEVFTNQEARYDTIVSSRTPLINVLMGHDVVTTYQGSGQINGSTPSSLTHLEDVLLYAINKGYTVCSFDEFHNMFFGRVAMPKRVALFILDDGRVAEAYQNLRNRAVISKYGRTLNFATINKGYNNPANIDANFRLFTSMRANGWCCASHSYRHDVRFGEKNSVLFIWELKQIQKDCDNLNWLNDVIVCNGLGGTINQYNCMEDAGFSMAFHNTGGEYVMRQSRYRITRTNIGDFGGAPYYNSVLI